MKNKIIIILALLLVTNLSAFAYGKTENWFDKISKIKLGVSTRQEVERLFDSPMVDKVNTFKATEDVYYKTKEGRLSVSYSLGRCPEGSDEFNLEKGTVVSLVFSASKSIKVSKLKLDLKEFKSYKESHSPTWVYSNADLGIVYVLFKKKLLDNVATYLTKAQEQQYSCKGNSQSSRIHFNPLESIMKWSDEMNTKLSIK